MTQIAGNLRPYVLVDMDCFLPGRAESRCDFLLVSNRGNWVVPMEMKRGRMHAREAVRQLQAGARVADKLVPARERTAFRPVAISGAIKRNELNLLKKQTVSFRGQKAIVLRIKCGETLSRDVLGSALTV